MIRISKGELKRRVEKLGKLMSEKDLDAIYISGTTSFKYFVDYFYIATASLWNLLVLSSGFPTNKFLSLSM